jgi:LysR family transcriptional regulator, transcriptional activator for bauABCD operon
VASKIHDADLKLLRLFRVVARSGGFSAAQDETGMSQSSISTNMARLESRLGMRLCDRGVRGFVLTEEGHNVLRACERIFASLNDFSHEIGRVKKTLSGELRLGLAGHLNDETAKQISEVIARWSEKYSEVHYSFFVGNVGEISARLIDGRLDCAIGAFVHKKSDLAFHDIGFEAHYLYCGVGHPLFNATNPIGKYSDGGFHLTKQRNNDETYGPDNLKVMTPRTSDQTEGLVLLILSGRHLIRIPEYYARPWVQSGRMKRVHVSQDRDQARVAVSLCTRQSPQMLRLTRAFVKEFKNISNGKLDGISMVGSHL